MMNEFIENMNEMTHDELKQCCIIVTELYLKYDDENELNRIAEYYRTQIDIIENYALKKFNKSTFDYTVK